MIRSFAMALTIALVLGVAVPAPAHEGHVHKVMGTVSTRHEHHLEVKSVDGKAVLITLNDATKILRGKAKVSADDIKPGERIVVAAKEIKGKDAKPILIASEVRLAASDAADR